MIFFSHQDPYWLYFEINEIGGSTSKMSMITVFTVIFPLSGLINLYQERLFLITADWKMQKILRFTLEGFFFIFMMSFVKKHKTTQLYLHYSE